MNKITQENLTEKYPSLQLAYEHVKDLLWRQKETARSYAERAILLLAASTAVVGIGIPILFNKTAYYKLYFLPGIPQGMVSSIPITIYLAIAVLTYLIVKLHPFKSMDEPSKILKSFAVRPNTKFYYDMIKNIEKAFKDNKKILERRATMLTLLIIATIVNTIIMVFLVVGITPLIS